MELIELLCFRADFFSSHISDQVDSEERNQSLSLTLTTTTHIFQHILDH